MADRPLQPGEIKLAGDGYVVVADGLAGPDLGDDILRCYLRDIGWMGIDSGFICGRSMHEKAQHEHKGQEKAGRTAVFSHRFGYDLSQDLSLCYCRISGS